MGSWVGAWASERAKGAARSASSSLRTRSAMILRPWEAEIVGA